MEARQEQDQVILRDVKGFGPNEYASSPNGCQARILQVLGLPISYDDLICYSAFAFRVEVHEQMCPSAGHPSCGYECSEGADLAQPWKIRAFDSAPWDGPKDDRVAFEAEACAAIRESIDRGMPVHYVGDHYAQIAELCLKDLKCSWDLALGPDRIDDWISEQRQNQIARLEAACEHDRAAVSAIAKALASLK